MNPPTTDPVATASVLEKFAAETLGLPGVRLEQQAGGASRSAYLVHGDTAPEALAFLRVDDGSGGLSGTSFTLPREGRLLQAVTHHGLPVPEILGILESPPALLMQVVPGDARVDRETAEQVGPEYMQLLARIHDIDPADVLPFASTDGAQALADDLEWWDRLAADGGADRAPLVVVARRALDLTRPPAEERATFLHGDAGAGNFLHLDGRVTGLIDWEMSHTGDYHEDIAWVCLRTIFTPFGSLARRTHEYEEASSRRIDRARLTWFQALVVWKSLVAVETTLRRSPGEKSDVSHLVAVTYRPLLAELAERILADVPLTSSQARTTLADVTALRTEADVAAADVPVARRVIERTRTEGMLS